MTVTRRMRNSRNHIALLVVCVVHCLNGNKQYEIW